MRCFFCAGPAHPATGCQYAARVLACYACTVAAWRWVREHTNAKASRRARRVPTALSFYEAAATSSPTALAATRRLRHGDPAG